MPPAARTWCTQFLPLPGSEHPTSSVQALWNARVYGHTTTAMIKLVHPTLHAPPSLLLSVSIFLCLPRIHSHLSLSLFLRVQGRRVDGKRDRKMVSTVDEDTLSRLPLRLAVGGRRSQRKGPRELLRALRIRHHGGQSAFQVIKRRFLPLIAFLLPPIQLSCLSDPHPTNQIFRHAFPPGRNGG